MSRTVESLNAAWSCWWAFLKDHSPGQPDQRQAIHARLLRFCDRHPDDIQHIEAVLASLSQGKHLAEAAVRWSKPVAGARGTPTDRARGEQFRLVMAHGAWETVRNALLPVADWHHQDEAEVRGLLLQSGLTHYGPLTPPRRELAELDRWLAFEEEPGRHPLTAFLKLHRGDARTLHAWLLDGRPIEDWYEALRLARVLRNSTVHGSLSATRVCRWGLRPAFRALVTDIGLVVAAALGRLAE
jgi:hypothetical protein